MVYKAELPQEEPYCHDGISGYCEGVQVSRLGIGCITLSLGWDCECGFQGDTLKKTRHCWAATAGDAGRFRKQNSTVHGGGEVRKIDREL